MKDLVMLYAVHLDTCMTKVVYIFENEQLTNLKY